MLNDFRLAAYLSVKHRFRIVSDEVSAGPRVIGNAHRRPEQGKGRTILTTVLLVDDSRIARMLARAVVQKAHPDWTIIEADTGEAAIATAATTRPDVILMDVNMPGMGGLAAARLLKAEFPQAAISMLTANIQDPVRNQATELGIAFLGKPIDDAQLRAFLDSGGPA